MSSLDRCSNKIDLISFRGSMQMHDWFVRVVMIVFIPNEVFNSEHINRHVLSIDDGDW